MKNFKEIDGLVPKNVVLDYIRAQLKFALFGVALAILSLHYGQKILDGVGNFIATFYLNSDLKWVIIFVIVGFIVVFWSRMEIFNRACQNNLKLLVPPITILDYFYIGICYFVPYLFVFPPLWSCREAILVNALGVVLWFLKRLHAVASKEKYNVNNLFDCWQEDDPIESDVYDLLSRKNFIDQIKECIMSTPRNASLTMGVCGAWGEGKTSILQILRNNLEKEKRYIVVDFDPWGYCDEKAILVGFCSELKNSIKKKYWLPDFRALLNQFHNIIQFGFANTPFSVKVDRLNNENSEYKSIFNKISKTISNLNEQVVVVIDDVDRLSFHEMMSVFKLSRYSANFKNTIFIVAFDEVTVKKVLKSNGIDGRYLDKIIQKKINLPVILQQQIDNVLLLSLTGVVSRDLLCELFTDRLSDDQISRVFEQFSYGLIFNKDLALDARDFKIDDFILLFRLKMSAQNSIFYKIGLDDSERKKFFEEFWGLFSQRTKNSLRTLRDIKRYLSGMRTILPIMHSEIYIGDCLFMEVLRNFFPDIWDEIKTRKEFYTLVDINCITEKDKNYFLSLVESEDKKRNESIKLILGYLFVGARVAYGEKDAAKFFVQDDRKIRNGRFLDVYFSQVSPRGVRSQVYIVSMLNNFKNNTKEEQVRQELTSIYRNGELVLFLNGLKSSIYTDKEAMEKMLLMLFDKRNRIDIGLEEIVMSVLDLMEIKSLDSLGFFKTMLNAKDKMPIIFYPSALFISRKAFLRPDSLNSMKELIEIFVLALEKYFLVEQRNIFREIPLINKMPKGAVIIIETWASVCCMKDLSQRDKITSYLCDIFKENSKAYYDFVYLTLNGYADFGNFDFSNTDIWKNRIKDLNKGCYDMRKVLASYKQIDSVTLTEPQADFLKKFYDTGASMMQAGLL